VVEAEWEPRFLDRMSVVRRPRWVIRAVVHVAILDLPNGYETLLATGPWTARACPAETPFRIGRNRCRRRGVYLS
jgi:hypothetical protein